MTKEKYNQLLEGIELIEAIKELQTILRKVPEIKEYYEDTEGFIRIEKEYNIKILGKRLFKSKTHKQYVTLTRPAMRRLVEYLNTELEIINERIEKLMEKK